MKSFSDNHLKKKKDYKVKVQQAIETVKEMVHNGECDFFILDEILGPINNEMITVEQVPMLIQMKIIETYYV
ncbi:cob(I)yrinic acid a,c-diamide adenosyltransferase [Natranaerovirga hydrolytica]|uniref:cob(I)yrinic acid a,c-diamide adenosyltransferase n=1 Tax=Natranaerovirga hydrolytica TaxID=680378 RepID=UPI00104E2E09